MIERKLPCYPLFVKDPNFSLWSNDEYLNATYPQTWFGEKKKICGFVTVNGKKYCFLGRFEDFNPYGVLPATQTDLRVTAFTTEYTFKAGEATLNVKFVSPLIPSDVELASMPVCYMRYELIGAQGEVSVFVGGNVSYNDIPQTQDKRVVSDSFSLNGYQAAVIGLRRQLPLSNTVDAIGADWGYCYLSGERAYACDGASMIGFLKHDDKTLSLTTEDRYIASFNAKNSGVIMLGYDETVAINYFGKYLQGYYLTNHSIFDALDFVHANSTDIDKKLADFDEKLRADISAKCSGFEKEYYNVLAASLRQSVAAHKLASDGENLLFLSKECWSNGSIATVDVSYPSIPLYLMYNTELVKGMMRPILKFARMPVWTFDFAPHDAGTYPSCNGQGYGLKKTVEEKLGTTFRQGDVVTRFPTYNLPANSDVYDLNGQMPVEESADMIIMFYACYYFDKDPSFFANNKDLADKWVGFLVENGLYPANQLCTDDFAGHLANNLNLAIKATVGIACYAELLRAVGDAEADKYRKIAENYADKISAFGRKFKHFPITWDATDSTYSLKYNMAFDKILNLKLFDKTLSEREVDCYLSHLFEFGVPLDNRKGYTKSDWLIWAASLTDDKQKQGKIVSSLDRFLRSGFERIPFSDWYETETSLHHEFLARSVQGGCFMLLLKNDEN